MAKEQFNAKYMKVSDISKMIGVSRYTVYDLIKNGTLQAIKIGNKMLVEVASLENYLESCKIKPNDITNDDIENDINE